jgi:hypothetical protein
MGTLPGQLAYVFLLSIFDAALLSWLTLRWYAHSMRKLMQAEAHPGAAPVDGRSVPPAANPPGAPACGPLKFAFFSDGTSSATAAPVSRRRLVLAYCVGAGLFSAVTSVLALRLETPVPPLPAWFGLWWINAWPIVPTLMVLLVLDWRGKLRVLAGYLVLGAVSLALVTLAGQLARGMFTITPLTNMSALVSGVVLTAWAPCIVLAITGWSRVRAVMPLALASTLAFGFTSMLFREGIIAGFEVPAFRSAVLRWSAYASSDIVYYGLFMLVALPVGWVAWRLLRALADRYDRKQFSDVQLVIDCWWLVVTADVVATSLAAPYGLAGIFGGLAAFVLYRAGVSVVLRAGATPYVSSPARLLLLRVFGYQARTEALFDRVAQRWRFRGPVQLIAGLDLATRAADPDDILLFIQGQLAQQYVASPDDVRRRVDGLDLGQDPDGRFRINELYCHGDTWKPTLQALLDATDGVLIDLRSFSEKNSGCLFELEQMVRRLPTERIVLVCDRTTDLRLLGAALSEAWDRAAREGVARGAGQIALVPIERQSRSELAGLTRRLLGLGTPQRVVSAAELPLSV